MVAVVRDVEPADPLPALASGPGRRARPGGSGAAGLGGGAGDRSVGRREATLAECGALGPLRMAFGHRTHALPGWQKLLRQSLGSGAMESTCRQYQARFKRTGQFWSQTGDEALMCLETFWRNGRWSLFFPHAQPPDPAKK